MQPTLKHVALLAQRVVMALVGARMVGHVSGLKGHKLYRCLYR